MKKIRCPSSANPPSLIYLLDTSRKYESLKMRSLLLLFISFGTLSAGGRPVSSDTIKAKKLFFHAVNLSAGYFILPDRPSSSPYQIGAGYEYKLYRQWYIGIAYSQWKSFSGHIAGKEVVVDEPVNFVEGELWNRVDYKMVDLYGQYSIMLNRHHNLTAGLGASYSWGYNSYLSHFFINPEPPRDAVIYKFGGYRNYWGAVARIGYNYRFLYDRLSIGGKINYRYYLSYPVGQTDLSIIGCLRF